VNSLDEFRSLGIEFVFLTEAVDFGSSPGAITFALIGAMAEFERNLIRERVSMGLERVRRQGKRIGRPRVEVDPRQIVGLRAPGRSWNQIANELGIGKGIAQRT
jgi:DNA invertase Pin-like site-specific DNA recombinase